MNEIKTCSKCGETKPLDEFSKDKNRKDGRYCYCKKCKSEYNKKRFQEQQKEILEYKRKYLREHPKEAREWSKNYRKKHIEEIKNRNKKWYEKIGRERAGCNSMYENKNCTQYLGIVIAERLCCHLFKDVEMMPYGYPEYDIICNRGKKINVKASSKHLNASGTTYWQFSINRNKITDYFICVAFDNVEDLNPLHLWMIPGKEVNNKPKISISSTTIHKWDEWKKDIKDAQLCCAELKESNHND